jgi:hypothetical protein
LRQLSIANNNSEPDVPGPPSSGTIGDSYQQTWETDSSIVEAVWYLTALASYMDSEQPVYFLNESRTVIPDSIHVEPPERSYGILVAAVGNADGMEVNSGPGEVEFARLAMPPNNVLAALDAKQDVDEPDCHSSKIAEIDLDNTMAASFDGTSLVFGKACCGGFL